MHEEDNEPLNNPALPGISVTYRLQGKRTHSSSQTIGWLQGPEFSSAQVEQTELVL